MRSPNGAGHSQAATAGSTGFRTSTLNLQTYPLPLRIEQKSRPSKNTANTLKNNCNLEKKLLRVSNNFLNCPFCKGELLFEKGF